MHDVKAGLDLERAKGAPTAHGARRRRSALLSGALLGGIAWSCAGTPAQPPTPRPSLLNEVQVQVSYPSPARWKYHPDSEAALYAKHELSSERTLYAGAQGERWLVDTRKKIASAASVLAPEALVGIVSLDGSGLLFIGRSGATYEARQPLGPFSRVSAPIDPLLDVSAAGRALAGVRFDGDLLHSSDAGQSWSRVGPDRTFFADVAVSPGGGGLALGIPEQLFRTDDAGKTWAPIDVPSVGATRLETDDKNNLLVQTASGWQRYVPRGGVPFQQVRRERDEALAYSLGVKPPRGPNAGAWAEGRAIVVGSRYFEIEPHESRRATYQLWSGVLEGKLSPREVKLSDCSEVRLAGFGSTLYVACFERGGSSAAVPVRLFRSGDAGKRFDEDGQLLWASLSEFQMAVGRDGALVLSGACAPHTAERGCDAEGVLHRRPVEDHDESADGGRGSDASADDEDEADHQGSGDSRGSMRRKQKRSHRQQSESDHELAASVVPALSGTAGAVAFSGDGRVAYAIGRRSKSSRWAVFVSRDGGRTFAARELEEEVQTAGRLQRWRARQPSHRFVESLTAAEDGTLGIVFRFESDLSFAVTDDDGRLLSYSTLPAESNLLGAVGARALALSTAEGKVWETLDGGASWQDLGAVPVDLCDKDRTCQVPVRCGVTGCVVGSELTRIGWRGQAEADVGLSRPGPASRRALAEQRVRTPISCVLEGESWEPLDGVDALPGAEVAGLGNVVWHALGSDPETASAWAYHASGGSRAAVTKEMLLKPIIRPVRHAFAIVNQIEGGAALRYRVGGGLDSEISDVEVAWDNRFEKHIGRIQLKGPIAARPGDFVTRAAYSRLARPDLLSIGAGGIYLRLHANGENQDTLFFDGKKVERIPPVPWPAEYASGRGEMARVNGQHVALRLVSRGVTVIRAARNQGTWQFGAMTIGIPDPDRFGLWQHSSITYVDGKAALSMHHQARGGWPRRALVFPLRAEGAIVDAPREAPTQAATLDPPRACTEDDRQDSPRVVSPYVPGTRHPVVIAHSIEPIRVLLTENAVMHGTPQGACIEALDAEQVRSLRQEADGDFSAILPLNDLEHAWVFQAAPGTNGKVLYRPMSCRFDAKLPVPPEVFAEEGTLASHAGMR